MKRPPTAQYEALVWLYKHGCDAIFDRNGVALAMGENAPHTRTTWNELQAAGFVEFYKPAGKGRGRMKLTRQGALMASTDSREYDAYLIRTRTGHERYGS